MLVLEVASQGAMSVALGLTFTIMVILIPATGVSAVIARSSDILRLFVCTFGVGAVVIGFLLRMIHGS